MNSEILKMILNLNQNEGMSKKCEFNINTDNSLMLTADNITMKQFKIEIKYSISGYTEIEI